MKRKLTDEQRLRNKKDSRLRYRQTEKGRLAQNKASLRYYHKTKQLKKKKVNDVEKNNNLIIISKPTKK